MRNSGGFTVFGSNLFPVTAIIGGRFFRSRSKTAATLNINGKKDIRLRPAAITNFFKVYGWKKQSIEI